MAQAVLSCEKLYASQLTACTESCLMGYKCNIDVSCKKGLGKAPHLETVLSLSPSLSLSVCLSS